MRPSLSRDIASAVFFADTRHFNSRKEELSARIAARAAATPCLVLSDEAFAFGEYMYITRQWQRQTVSDHDVIAHRLAALCGPATVTISLRAQPSFLKSIYKQGIKRGHVTEAFDDYISREIDALPHRSMLHTLRYDHCHAAYADRFGTNNVHLSLFEDSMQDFASYLRSFAQISGLDAEALISEWGGAHENVDRPRKERESVKRLRQVMPPALKRLFPTNAKKILREKLAKPAADVSFSSSQSHVIHDYFARANADLAITADINLIGKGYPLP